MDTVQKLIFAFVTLIVGLMLIGEVATQGNEVTDIQTATDTIYFGRNAANTTMINESTNFTLAEMDATSWKSAYSECLPSTVIVKNASGDVQTVNVGYRYSSTRGSVSYINIEGLNNSGTGTNLTTVTYTYCPDDYLTESWSRSTLDLVSGLFALGLMAVSVGLFWSIVKDYDWM